MTKYREKSQLEKIMDVLILIWVIAFALFLVLGITRACLATDFDVTGDIWLQPHHNKTDNGGKLSLSTEFSGIITTGINDSINIRMQTTAGYSGGRTKLEFEHLAHRECKENVVSENKETWRLNLLYTISKRDPLAFLGVFEITGNKDHVFGTDELMLGLGPGIEYRRGKVTLTVWSTVAVMDNLAGYDIAILPRESLIWNVSDNFTLEQNLSVTIKTEEDGYVANGIIKGVLQLTEVLNFNLGVDITRDSKQPKERRHRNLFFFGFGFDY